MWKNKFTNKRIVLTEDISLVEEVKMTELENRKKNNMRKEVAYSRQKCIYINVY